MFNSSQAPQPTSPIKTSPTSPTEGLVEPAPGFTDMRNGLRKPKAYTLDFAERGAVSSKKGLLDMPSPLLEFILSSLPL